MTERRAAEGRAAGRIAAERVAAADGANQGGWLARCAGLPHCYEAPRQSLAFGTVRQFYSILHEDSEVVPSRY